MSQDAQAGVTQPVEVDNYRIVWGGNFSTVPINIVEKIHSSSSSAAAAAVCETNLSLTHVEVVTSNTAVHDT